MIWVIGDIIIKCLALVFIYMVVCELNYTQCHYYDREECPNWNFLKYIDEEE